MSALFFGRSRLTDARMSSADLVHRYGLGFSLVCDEGSDVVLNCRIEVWTPRRSCFLVSLEMGWPDWMLSGGFSLALWALR
jgi:hypothetical protein